MANLNPIDPQEYLPLVKKIVDRIDVKLPSHWEREDMIGYGLLGLMEAVERFQHDRGVKFSTYASIRIKGAIMDALRRDAPVSRGNWDNIRKITEAMEHISQFEGREASLEEIAERVGMKKKEVEEALESLKFLSHTSLDQLIGISEESDIKLMDLISTEKKEEPEEKILKYEQIEMLGRAISQLDKRQKQVLTLYYYEELSMKEIAAVLNVTVSRVSQLKTMALVNIRKILAGD